jgi:hypothetical protein
VRTELIVAQGELARLRMGRDAATLANEHADGVLAAALARAREETVAVSEEYAVAAARLQTVEDELAAVQAQLEEAKHGWEEEKTGSLEAAAVASQASYARAELEAESGSLLGQLIAAKVQCASLAMERDEERRRAIALKRRLQKYAERLNRLEVSRTLARPGAPPPPPKEQLYPPSRPPQQQLQQQPVPRQFRN